MKRVAATKSQTNPQTNPQAPNGNHVSFLNLYRPNRYIFLNLLLFVSVLQVLLQRPPASGDQVRDERDASLVSVVQRKSSVRRHQVSVEVQDNLYGLQSHILYRYVFLLIVRFTPRGVVDVFLYHFSHHHLSFFSIVSRTACLFHCVIKNLHNFGNIQLYTPITVYETAPFQTRKI